MKDFHADLSQQSWWKGFSRFRLYPFDNWLRTAKIHATGDRRKAGWHCLEPDTLVAELEICRIVPGIPKRDDLMSRISKNEYYLNIAKEVSMRATCLRRWFGAVIVQQDQIIATGYNGPPRATKNCIEIGLCAREQLNIKHGENYEICRGVHAEQNAIIHASRLDMLRSTLFLVGIDAKTREIVSNTEPCKICKRMIINAGIEVVVVLKPGGEVVKFSVKEWIDDNIDELEYVGNQWRPKIKSGY